ncbi:Oidioi.mRNA.OKI2018_I69.chr1.g386.t2.cds [Oikopleura dioica]|uniref:Oidioi.mRNA.OKI2018_I69.chr1.g386.t2.cds n=1 Tax=Oikopleura dioica TaxID=34765 RepID=A0ABN7SJP0_OIKDI|nr:Oidioi.mRNA.OKI2018_I69.chr1.g386.t2.cds [Oikopleura dioica]
MAQIPMIGGPKLGSTLLTEPKWQSNSNSCEDTLSSSSGASSDCNTQSAIQETSLPTFEQQKMENLQALYNNLKKTQQPASKSSFSIDDLAKSSSFSPQSTPFATSLAQNAINPFAFQHQELYRKAIENLKSSGNPPSTPNPIAPHPHNENHQNNHSHKNSSNHHQRPLTPSLPAHFMLGQTNPAMNPMIAQQMQLARLQQHAIQRQQMKMRGIAAMQQQRAASSRDAVSASIVREAKSQLKGLDPENMYIECPLCHKRIKRLYHFQRHMRIHSGEKSHQCPWCPYRSVRKDNLKSHLKTHEKHALEARRNAAYLDKKRQNEIDAMRRLHQFSVNQLAISAIPKTEGQKDVDSGCESPEELSSKGSSPRQNCCPSSSDSSSASDRHTSKESDTSFSIIEIE